MFSVLFHVYSLRWTVPCFVLMGVAPIYNTVWGLLRTLTAPLPQRIYRIGDDAMFSHYFRLVLFFFHTYAKPKVYFYGDINQLLKDDENVIYLSNHQCTVDWIVAGILSEQKGCPGIVRYIMKDGLKYLPLYGHYFYQHGNVFVGRSGKFKKEKLEKQLQYLKCNNMPVWLVIFPEGTRYNPDLPQVIEKSKQFALESGYTELQHVLTPRTQAFKCSLQQLAGHVTAVYDVTIAYSNTFNSESGERTPAYGMPDFLMGKSAEIHLNLERINIKDIPTDENKLNDWMYKQFAKKDRLLSEFYNPDSDNFGKFPGVSSVINVKARRTIPPFLFYSISLAAIMSTASSRDLYWKITLAMSIGGIIWVSIRL